MLTACRPVEANAWLSVRLVVALEAATLSVCTGVPSTDHTTVIASAWGSDTLTGIDRGTPYCRSRAQSRKPPAAGCSARRGVIDESACSSVSLVAVYEMM